MVSSTHRPHFTPGKDPVPILQEAGWAPAQVWTGGKTRPHRDSIPDRPARSQSPRLHTFGKYTNRPSVTGTLDFQTPSFTDQNAIYVSVFFIKPSSGTSIRI